MSGRLDGSRAEFSRRFVFLNMVRDGVTLLPAIPSASYTNWRTSLPVDRVRSLCGVDPSCVFHPSTEHEGFDANETQCILPQI
jgi:hypothetical protein